MATLKQMVFEKIVNGERVSCYKIYDEYWYVVIWNKQTYIHYTQKLTEGSVKFLWYLSANILAPKWKAQTQQIEVKAQQNKALLC
jgi:hypothetical protein